MVLELTRQDARRVAVRAQRLTARRPEGVLDAVRALSFLQHDPIAAVAPSADLVLFSRLGSSYDPRELADLLDQQRVIDLHGLLRPAEDLALFTAEMAQWPGPDPESWHQQNARWLEDNRGARADVLDLLRSDGPLTAAELPDTCARPWRSSGWNNRRNVTMLLEQMVRAGDVAVAGRRGREKLWDLAERVYPAVEPVPLAEALRRRDERRLRSLGVVRATGPATQTEPLDAGEQGELAVIEGVKGRWRVAPGLLAEPFEPRTALLSPLDRLLFDRTRMERLFEFEYTLEMYKPAAARRWGYYALPVLHGDRLVGKLDAAADRKAGRLVVHAVHQDFPWPRDVRAAVDDEITDLARWLELDLERSEGG
ncbi:winged helix DNA-binding domain-containing protein [Cellulomonas sp. DKR-3]|uniref:Winged helix DNA-binding domain-containing protein n=1 Tax=Cellulomonas fulva TaxID=2835530 RepID=A0ABS5TY65_9CELL|nr:crosslink repair DNA glycosylase YcaQ family protein [Cellulomonas fulva]MBT0994083.1 winged helix DNA-binding domain-containing protein [Cellulomonas fulva]